MLFSFLVRLRFPANQTEKLRGKNFRFHYCIYTQKRKFIPIKTRIASEQEKQQFKIALNDPKSEIVW